MSIFGYPMDPWVHIGTLVFLSLRANEHRRGDLREIALQERVWSQYWASWMPYWIAASQWLMSIFGYPMDPWVHTGTLVFLSLRANEHRGADLREIALNIGFNHNIGQAKCHCEDIYFVIPQVKGKGGRGGNLCKEVLQYRVWSQFGVSLAP